ncbi:MAG: hypothetical protein JOZ37_01170 [Actinobacteria bacterium]|nr:hypothetical protein [Actinomycetota bacterium]
MAQSSRPTLPLVDIALAPTRLVVEVLQALPRLADGLENLGSVLAALDRIAEFEVYLDRIASFGRTLDQLAGLSDSLAAVAESTKGLGALTDAVDQLEHAAAELTRAVQPLQGVAQRIARIGRRGDQPTP